MSLTKVPSTCVNKKLSVIFGSRDVIKFWSSPDLKPWTHGFDACKTASYLFSGGNCWSGTLPAGLPTQSRHLFSRTFVNWATQYCFSSNSKIKRNSRFCILLCLLFVFMIIFKYLNFLWINHYILEPEPTCPFSSSPALQPWAPVLVLAPPYSLKH